MMGPMEYGHCHLKVAGVLCGTQPVCGTCGEGY